MYKLNGEDKGSTIAINRIVCQILGLDNEAVIYPDCATADLPTLTSGDANKAVCFDTTAKKIKVRDGDSRENIAIS
jgi:hypothetical protein